MINSHLRKNIKSEGAKAKLRNIFAKYKLDGDLKKCTEKMFEIRNKITICSNRIRRYEQKYKAKV